MYLIPTLQSRHLAQRIGAKAKKVKVVFPSLNKEGRRYFPDGEMYMKIVRPRALQGQRVVVLHTGSPKPNEGLIELELILQILRDHGVRPEIVFSYFPYAMQDRVFGKGETNVAENLVEKLVNYYKAKEIYIVDAHFAGRKWIKKYPLRNLSAVPILVVQAKRDFGDDILFISPDRGGKRRTKISGFQKKRLDSFNVKITPSNAKLKGKIVAVVDDILKTGGTLLTCANIIKKSGAKSVLALVTHGVIKEGIAKVYKAYSKLYLANTIDQKRANVDVAGVILQALLESED